MFAVMIYCLDIVTQWAVLSLTTYNRTGINTLPQEWVQPLLSDSKQFCPHVCFPSPHLEEF